MLKVKEVIGAKRNIRKHRVKIGRPVVRAITLLPLAF
jgi:hypothetical protein